MPHEETLERRLARSMEPHSDVTDGCFSTAETASLSRSKSRTSSLRDIFGLGRTKKVDEKAKLAQSMEQLTSTQDGLRTQITELQESVAKLGIDEDAKAWRHWVQSTLEGAVAAQKAQEERFDDIQKILEQQAEMLKNQGEQFLAALTPIQQTVEKLLMKSEKKVRFQEGTKGGDDFDEPSTPIPPPRTLFSSCSSQENPRTALFMVGTSSESFQDSEARDSGDKPIFGSGKPIFGFDSVTGEDIFSGTPSKPTPNPKDFQFGVPRGSSGSIESGDDESQAHFDPLVSLPPVVDLKTGEEDEEVLFCERARIYRYIPALKAYKERGTGEIKILRNPETSAYRVVMRREQVLKLCANFRLTSGMKISAREDGRSACMFCARDFAEDAEGEFLSLAVRFRSEDSRDVFMALFDEGVKFAESTR